MSAARIVFLAVAAVVAGSVNTVAGGGSLISFPALLAVGLAPVAANVTNTVAVWPGYLGGVVAYRRELAGQRRRGLALSAVSVVGAGAGSALLLLAPARLFVIVAPYLILLASLLLAAQPRLARGLAARRAAASPAGSRGSQRVLVVAVFAAAVYGAYFGAGLGIMLLALLAVLVPDTLQRHNGVKVLLSLVINTVALVVFAVFGPVHWIAVLVMSAASLAGGYLGGGIARRLPPAILRAGIVGFGVLASALLIIRG